MNQLEHACRILAAAGWPRGAIDPNVRVRGGQTLAGLEDVDRPVAVGDRVRVFEAESGLEGYGVVTGLDLLSRLVYLEVGWPSLKPCDEFDEVDTTEAEWDRMWSEGVPVELQEEP